MADRVRLVRQRRAMPDRAALLGWLHSQVFPAYRDITDIQGFIATAQQRAIAELRRTDGSYDQDYVRLDLLAHRPA